MSVGQELLNAPFPEMVQKLAVSISEAQTKLDMNSTAVAEVMSQAEITLPSIKDPKKTSKYPLLAMGFLPTFYQMQEAEIEVKMAITIAKSRDKTVGASAKAGWGPFSASVNASYSSKYNFKQEGASTLRVKMAPAPPPAILEAYMNALIAEAQKGIEKDLGGTPPPPPPPSS